MRNLWAASAASVLLSLPVSAATLDVGQPFLIIEQDISGSILDYFDTFGPSGLKQVSVSGTITETFGAPALVGTTFSFNTSQAPLNTGAALTLGSSGVSTFAFTLFDTGTGAYDLDPFQPDGPGDMNFKVLVSPAFTELSFDPITLESTFSYLNDFAAFGPRTQDFPEFELFLSIYLDGPLPTKIYEERDPITDDLLYTTDYIEGPLSISRITLGTIGGPPVPVAAVPLPASILLLAGGLAGLGALRRRQPRA